MLGTPKAMPALEKRLLSDDYAYGPRLLRGLAQQQDWLEDNHQLLKEAMDSRNAATQSAKKLRSGQASEIDEQNKALGPAVAPAGHGEWGMEKSRPR